jgi:hypothetical protein
MELTPEQITAYLERAEKVLTPADFWAARGMAATTSCVCEELKSKRASVRRLQAMLYGIKTEKTTKVCPPPKSAASGSGEGQAPKGTPGKETEKTKRPGHGRNAASGIPGAEKVRVGFADLWSGSECPECPKGKLYPMLAPAVMVRIVGMSPLHATVIERDRMRCNLCGEIRTAPAPEGVGTQKYDETVPAMVGLLKYGTGTPFFRLEQLQKHLGIPMPASTQWKLVNEASETLEPVFDELIQQAAQAQVIHNDDTTMKLLDRPDLQRKGKKTRTAVYTSGIVAKLSGRIIALFRTGMKHAGENLALVLMHRAAERAKPIQMCDALSANTAGEMGVLDTILAHCLTHARRRFVDVVDSFPDECRHLLETLGVVYRNDALTKDMPPGKRLEFHQIHSGPPMEELRLWLRDQLEGRKTEPHSGLGKAITYMLKHWVELTLFLRDGLAPLDNNLCERVLKRAILHRKNALFYKTQNGARVGDIFMSLIHTAELNKANPFQYLVALLRNAALVEENPEEWMPWNYQETLAGLPR